MKQFKQLLQEAVSYTYRVPTSHISPESLYDFYFWTMVQPLFPDSLEQSGLDASVYLGGEENFQDLQVIIEEATKKIVDWHLDELLQALVVSIASEARHTYTHTYNYDVKLMVTNTFWNFVNAVEDASQLMDHIPDNAPSWFHYSGSQQERNDALYAMFDNYGKTLKDISFFIDDAMDAFNTLDWSGAYGGPKWAEGCSAWFELYNLKDSKDIKEKSVWIDHAYDLEHNSGAFLNKVRELSYGGYSWIRETLDSKRYIRPDELVKKSSVPTRIFGMIRRFVPSLNTDESIGSNIVNSKNVPLKHTKDKVENDPDIQMVEDALRPDSYKVKNFGKYNTALAGPIVPHAYSLINIFYGLHSSYLLKKGITIGDIEKYVKEKPGSIMNLNDPQYIDYTNPFINHFPNLSLEYMASGEVHMVIYQGFRQTLKDMTLQYASKKINPGDICYVSNAAYIEAGVAKHFQYRIADISSLKKPTFLPNIFVDEQKGRIVTGTREVMNDLIGDRAMLHCSFIENFDVDAWKEIGNLKVSQEKDIGPKLQSMMRLKSSYVMMFRHRKIKTPFNVVILPIGEKYSKEIPFIGESSTYVTKISGRFVSKWYAFGLNLGTKQLYKLEY